MPTQAQKAAIARIFADLIKADRLIDTGEMECWTNICLRYDIDRDMRVKARNISFAQAINTICDTDAGALREDLLGDCRAMTVSDGFCAHSEALLMVTLISMLGSDNDMPVDVISIPRSNFNIDNASVLYVENSYDEEINAAIRRDYRTIFKELQLGGFHFVYIPTIIEHYRTTPEPLFKDILSFLAPNLADDQLDHTYTRLMDMTTGEFCRDMLCNKCGITELRNTPPAILVKIGNSFVGQQQFANYLKIEVDENIADTVRTLVDMCTGMLSSDIFVINTSEERGNQFHFHGFYKQLLDIFLVQSGTRSDIIINPRKEEIIFKGVGKLSDVNRRERALYTLLLCQGADGLDFRKPAAGSPAMRAYEKRMERIMRRYTAIYEMMGGNPENAPDLKTSSIRLPIVACLKRSLKKLDGLYNPEDYHITSIQRGMLSVDISPEKVFVLPYAEDTPDKAIPLMESELYRRVAAL